MEIKKITILKGLSRDGTKDVYTASIFDGEKWQNVYLTKSKEGQLDKFGRENLYFYNADFVPGQKKGEFVTEKTKKDDDPQVTDSIPF